MVPLGTEMNGTLQEGRRLIRHKAGGPIMGRGILLWMLGVPLPIIILLALFR